MPRRNRVPHVGDPPDQTTVYGHDSITRPEAGTGGGGALAHRRNNRRAVDRIPRSITDTEDAAPERLSCGEPRKHREQVLERHREADAGVVELRASHHLRGLGRERRHDADHPTGDVDERTSVVHWRDRRVGLHGEPPAAFHRGQDAHRHARLGGRPAAADGDRPLARRKTAARRRLDHRRGRNRVGLQEHDAPWHVAAERLGRHAAAIGQHHHRLASGLGHGERRGEHEPR